MIFLFPHRILMSAALPLSPFHLAAAVFSRPTGLTPRGSPPNPYLLLRPTTMLPFMGRGHPRGTLFVLGAPPLRPISPRATQLRLPSPL